MQPPPQGFFPPQAPASQHPYGYGAPQPPPQQPAPNPAMAAPLQRDAVVSGATYQFANTVEFLLLGGIAAVQLGQVDGLVVLALPVWLFTRLFRHWVVFDPATRTVQRARWFSSMTTGMALPFAQARPSMTTQKTRYVRRRGGLKTGTGSSYQYTVDVGQAGFASFETSDRDIAETFCVWAILAVGGTATHEQVQTAMRTYRKQVSGAAWALFWMALSALGLSLWFRLDRQEFARHGYEPMFFSIGVMLPFLLGAAWRVRNAERWPACVPVPGNAAAGRRQAWMMVAITALVSIGALAHGMNRQSTERTSRDETNRRIDAIMAAQENNRSVSGARMPPRNFMTLTTLAALPTRAEAQSRLEAVGFRVAPFENPGVAGFNQWHLSASTGAGGGAYLRAFALSGPNFTVGRSRRFVIAVGGPDPVARREIANGVAASITAPQHMLGGALQDALRGLRLRVLPGGSESYQRVRNGRTEYDVQVVDLGATTSRAHPLENASHLVVAFEMYGEDFTVMGNWANYVLATALTAGQP